MDNLQIVLHLISVNFEMLTSNVQLGYLLARGRRVGGSCLGRFILPPSRISERIGNPKILLHRLLQEHLVERDIDFISCNLRCFLQTFSRVMYWQGIGGKLSRAVCLRPSASPGISEIMDNTQILLHHLLQEYFVERDINFIAVSIRCLLQTSGRVTSGQGVWCKLSRAVYLGPRLEFQRW